jgi:hypothetical protein
MSQYNEVILPESVFESVRSFQQYIKRTVRIEPQGTSGSITGNQQVEFALPVGTLVDISSLAVMLEGITLTGTSPALPAFSDSFIQRVEVLSNGNTIQVINNYNVIMTLMRGLAESTDHATSFGNVYQGTSNAAVTATNANWVNIISNWLGFLGCKKLIDVSTHSGMMDLRVRLTMAPNNILAGTDSPTYSIGKIYATVNVVAMSEPSLEAAIKSLNGTPEIAFDYFQNYAETVNGAGTLNMKVPVVASSLKHIVLTSRVTSYNTNAALASNQGRAFNTSNFFKYDGSNLSNVYIDTGSGNFPSSALPKPAHMCYFTAQSLNLDDNWATGACGFDDLADYSNWGFGVVFGFGHTDAPAGLLIGYNTKGNASMLIRGDQAGASNYQYDAFTVSSAVLTLKPGQWALQV